MLFCYTHDVLRSMRAPENVFAAVRPGARIASVGAKSFPWAAAPPVYAIAFLGVLHYWWLVKRDIIEPLAFALVAGALLAARIAWPKRTRAGRGPIELAATHLVEPRSRSA